jgi:hypothetical protein
LNPKPQAKIHEQSSRPRAWEFELAIGQESILPPTGFMNPNRVYLLGLRNRPLYLARVRPEVFEEMGRTYRFERQEMPTHLKGVPIYYCIEDQELKFWPVPAHGWKGVLEAGLAPESAT